MDNDPGDGRWLTVAVDPHYKSVPMDSGRTAALRRLEYLRTNDRITQAEYQVALSTIDVELPE